MATIDPHSLEFLAQLADMSPEQLQDLLDRRDLILDAMSTCVVFKAAVVCENLDLIPVILRAYPDNSWAGFRPMHEALLLWNEQAGMAVLDMCAHRLPEEPNDYLSLALAYGMPNLATRLVSLSTMEQNSHAALLCADHALVSPEIVKKRGGFVAPLHIVRQITHLVCAEALLPLCVAQGCASIMAESLSESGGRELASIEDYLLEKMIQGKVGRVPHRWENWMEHSKVMQAWFEHLNGQIPQAFAQAQSRRL